MFQSVRQVIIAKLERDKAKKINIFFSFLLHIRERRGKPKDQIVQETMCMIFDRFYELLFSNSLHRFRLS